MTPWKAFHPSNSTLSCTSPRLVDRHSQRALDPWIFSEEAMALSIFPSFGVSLARTCCKNPTSSFAHISQTRTNFFEWLLRVPKVSASRCIVISSLVLLQSTVILSSISHWLQNGLLNRQK